MKHFKSLSELNTSGIDDKKAQLESHNKAKQEYTTKIENINKSIEE